MNQNLKMIAIISSVIAICATAIICTKMICERNRFCHITTTKAGVHLILDKKAGKVVAEKPAARQSD